MLYSLSDGGEHSQKSICREWLIPKTTINSIVRKMLGDGTVEVTSLSGREKMLKLTDGGMEKAAGTLAGLHAAEKYAMQKTLEKFDASFIDALETFSQHLEEFGEK